MIDDLLMRVLGRADGVAYARVLLQPAVALAWAVFAGFRKVRRAEGSSVGPREFDPLFYTAVAADLIFNLLASKKFYPLQSLLLVLVLAIPVYYALRRPVSGLIAKLMGAKK